MPQIYIEEVIVIAVQFEKTGVVSASGKGVNPNIAEKTSGAYSAVSTTDAGRDTWSWFCYNKNGWLHSNIPVESGQDYTLSFDYEMTNAPEGSGCGIGTKSADIYYDYDRWDSRALYATYGDGLNKGHFVYHMEAKDLSSTNPNSKYFAFRALRHTLTADQLSSPITIKIWNFKIEKGSVATPWCPNESDTEYVGSTLGFTEAEDTPSIGKAGYVQATEFIEW